MTVGALIGAYQEDDEGDLRALLPLAGRSVLDYQVRSAAAAGASPVVVLVERVPQSLQDVFERLRLDGIAVTQAGDVHEAVSRFEARSDILLVGDGVVLPAASLARLAEESGATIVTVPDDDLHQSFERIDSDTRWAGIALIEGTMLASTAKMLGDWDLQSTLLRRTIQEGARHVPLDTGAGDALLAEERQALDAFQERLFDASRAQRSDWPSRFLFPPIEEFATAQLMDSEIRPRWLIWLALFLTLGAALLFGLGWPGTALALLVIAAPLDLIAERLANLRLQPLPAKVPSRSLLWPASGLAALALAWFTANRGAGTDWMPVVATIAGLAFAQGARIEKAIFPANAEIWLFSRRGAIVSAIPFALLGAWTAYLVMLWLYAMASFFIAQNARHSRNELTRI